MPIKALPNVAMVMLKALPKITAPVKAMSVKRVISCLGPKVSDRTPTRG
ncbi:MAG: hypothetical protein ABIL06_14930 [Pseudomonadota bacterium]